MSVDDGDGGVAETIGNQELPLSEPADERQIVVSWRKIL